MVTQLLRVSSPRPCWRSTDRGGVFASATPQTAELVAELFAIERDHFCPLQLHFISTFEDVFFFDQLGWVVEVVHLQRAVSRIPI